MSFTFPDHQILAKAHLVQSCRYANAHVSRATDKQQVTKFLNFTDLPFADPDTGIPYAFCAAGSLYALAHALCDIVHTPYTASTSVAVFQGFIPALEAHYIKVSASCEEVRQDAIKRGTWIPRGRGVKAKPGWVALFNFENSTSEAHHFTLIISQDGDVLHTVEFNTSDSSQGNGGAVAYKTRTIQSEHFRGFIKTY